MPEEEEIDKAKKAVTKKRIAKQITLRDAYKRIFLNDNGNLKAETLIVLRDLARFCYANKPTAKLSQKTGCIDPNAMLIAEGRRESYLRVLNQINVSDAVFNRLLTQYYDESDL